MVAQQVTSLPVPAVVGTPIQRAAGRSFPPATASRTSCTLFRSRP